MGAYMKSNVKLVNKQAKNEVEVVLGGGVDETSVSF